MKSYFNYLASLMATGTLAFSSLEMRADEYLTGEVKNTRIMKHSLGTTFAMDLSVGSNDVRTFYVNNSEEEAKEVYNTVCTGYVVTIDISPSKSPSFERGPAKKEDKEFFISKKQIVEVKEQ